MSDRYKTPWYSKRIHENRMIKNFLIGKIEQHRDLNLVWNQEDLYCLNYEDLLELAIAVVNKDLTITLGAGADYDNGVDAKFSIVRSHTYGEAYSSGITGCSNKEWIAACVYEARQNKFYFFSFAAKLTQHTIPFNTETGEPIRVTQRGPNHMWKFAECETFEDMALSHSGNIRTRHMIAYHKLHGDNAQ